LAGTANLCFQPGPTKANRQIREKGEATGNAGNQNLPAAQKLSITGTCLQRSVIDHPPALPRFFSRATQ
jgi:hypothetical protein